MKDGLLTVAGQCQRLSKSLQILIGKPRPVGLITTDAITELSVYSDLSS